MAASRRERTKHLLVSSHSRWLTRNTATQRVLFTLQWPSSCLNRLIATVLLIQVAFCFVLTAEDQLVDVGSGSGVMMSSGVGSGSAEQPTDDGKFTGNYLAIV